MYRRSFVLWPSRNGDTFCQRKDTSFRPFQESCVIEGDYLLETKTGYLGLFISAGITYQCREYLSVHELPSTVRNTYHLRDCSSASGLFISVGIAYQCMDYLSVYGLVSGVGITYQCRDCRQKYGVLISKGTAYLFQDYLSV